MPGCGSSAWEAPRAICLYSGGATQEITARGNFCGPVLLNNQGKVLYFGFNELDGNFYLYDAGSTSIIATGTNQGLVNPTINDLGQIVYAAYDNTGHTQVFLYYQGVTTKISQSLKLGNNNYPQINNRGQVAWVHYDDDMRWQIVLYEGGKVEQVTSGYWSFDSWTLRLNDRGQIAWIGKRQTSAATGQVFLASPVDSSSFYLLLLLD